MNMNISDINPVSGEYLFTGRIRRDVGGIKSGEVVDVYRIEDTSSPLLLAKAVDRPATAYVSIEEVDMSGEGGGLWEWIRFLLMTVALVHLCLFLLWLAGCIAD